MTSLLLTGNPLLSVPVLDMRAWAGARLGTREACWPRLVAGSISSPVCAGPSLSSAYGHTLFPVSDVLEELALETHKCLSVIRVLLMVNLELKLLLRLVPVASAQPQLGLRTVSLHHHGPYWPGTQTGSSGLLMLSQSPCKMVPSRARYPDHVSSLFVLFF